MWNVKGEAQQNIDGLPPDTPKRHGRGKGRVRALFPYAGMRSVYTRCYVAVQVSLLAGIISS